MEIKVTDDKAWAEEVRAALKANDGYCPCSIEKTEDTKCICKEFRAQESGKCHCGLYEKEETSETNTDSDSGDTAHHTNHGRSGSTGAE